MKAFRDWRFHVTENGWTDDDTGYAWFTEVFLPLTTPEPLNAPRLLILDGHGSYVTDRFMLKAFENNVHLLYLLAHTSHVLQPLDLSVFSPLKRYYRFKILEVLEGGHHEDTVAGKRAFLMVYDWVRSRALTGLNIRAGWKASGLWPVNIAKPLGSRHLLANSNTNNLTSLPNDSPEVQSF